MQRKRNILVRRCRNDSGVDGAPNSSGSFQAARYISGCLGPEQAMLLRSLLAACSLIDRILIAGLKHQLSVSPRLVLVSPRTHLRVRKSIIAR